MFSLAQCTGPARCSRVRSVAVLLATVAPTALAGTAFGAAAPGSPPTHPYADYQWADSHDGGVRVGGSPAAFSKTPTDTFYLYGGPGIYPGLPDFQPQGKFETATGAPDRQGWTGVDRTQPVPHWHVSTFNAPKLPAVAPSWWQGGWSVPSPNHAMWVGVEAGTSGFQTAPGYGNLWDEWLSLRFPAPDPAQSTTVQLGLLFNHDTEPAYDYFLVERDSAGALLTLATIDGSNAGPSGSFPTPAELLRSMEYQPGDYAGGTDIELRLHFLSDGAWSDEDGAFPTSGAAQLDAVQVLANGAVVSQTGFEEGDTGGWLVSTAPFCGDFSKVLPLLTDLDPCRANRSQQMTFVDTGAPPNNDPLQRSTGGSLSATWSYGVVGGWVVNYTDGLSLGQKPLRNEVWSPPIDWELPGPQDDGALTDGASLRFTYWAHTPFPNGIVTGWQVRSRPDPDSGGWSNWRSRDLVYFGGPRWVNPELPIRDLLVQEPEQVQVALGVYDLAALFGLPGNDATPSPTFDNVALLKFNAASPTIVGREIDGFQDSFPQSGAVTCTELDDTALAIRLDMARDIRPMASPGSVPGDSVIADFSVSTPGMALDTASVHLEFVLDTNPCFDDERAAGLAALQAGAGSGDSDVQQIAPNKHRGYVRGRPARSASGVVVPNRYYFDLPDGPVTLASYQSPEPALFFPGDRLRWFFAASTTGVVESATLPADTTRFTWGYGYDHAFGIAGLPGLRCSASDDAPCTQPPILVWNDLGNRGGWEELLLAFNTNLVTESYELFTTVGPTSSLSNGLGSTGRHGASAAQMQGYTTLFYESGDLASNLLSDGSGVGNNDKGNDVGLLQAWFAQPGPRAAAYWGDNIAWGLSGGGATFRDQILKVSAVADDVRGAIGGQTAPRVDATAQGVGLGFGVRYMAYGGCLGINRFDHIAPGSGAVMAHEFLDPNGAGDAYTAAASVYWARQDSVVGQPYSRINVTFPYGLCYVYSETGGPNQGGGRTAAANLVRELAVGFGLSEWMDNFTPSAAPVAPRHLALAQNHPNPFNPATAIRLEAPTRGRLTVRVYNLRGELVSTLLDGEVAAGWHELVWRGSDARGAAVASGVYVCRAEGFGQARAVRMVLLR